MVLLWGMAFQLSLLVRVLIPEYERVNLPILISLGLLSLWFGTHFSNHIFSPLAVLIQIFLTLMLGLFPLSYPLFLLFFIFFLHGMMASLWKQYVQWAVAQTLSIFMITELITYLIYSQGIKIDLWSIQIVMSSCCFGCVFIRTFLRVMDTPCS